MLKLLTAHSDIVVQAHVTISKSYVNTNQNCILCEMCRCVADRKDIPTLSTLGGHASSRSPTPNSAKLGLELAKSALSVVRDQLEWTIYMSRVNLPAVLNDPTLARRETDFFKKTWGEDFEKSEVPPSSHLPHITLDSFRKYLAKNSAVSICIIIIVYCTLSF